MGDVRDENLREHARRCKRRRQVHAGIGQRKHEPLPHASTSLPLYMSTIAFQARAAHIQVPPPAPHAPLHEASEVLAQDGELRVEGVQDEAPILAHLLLLAALEQLQAAREGPARGRVAQAAHARDGAHLALR